MMYLALITLLTTHLVSSVDIQACGTIQITEYSDPKCEKKVKGTRKFPNPDVKNFDNWDTCSNDKASDASFYCSLNKNGKKSEVYMDLIPAQNCAHHGHKTWNFTMELGKCLKHPLAGDKKVFVKVEQTKKGSNKYLRKSTPKPIPVETKPTPVVPKPTPVQTQPSTQKPTPVQTKPTPVETKPTTQKPTPVQTQPSTQKPPVQKSQTTSKGPAQHQQEPMTAMTHTKPMSKDHPDSQPMGKTGPMQKMGSLLSEFLSKGEHGPMGHMKAQTKAPSMLVSLYGKPMTSSYHPEFGYFGQRFPSRGPSRSPSTSSPNTAPSVTPGTPSASPSVTPSASPSATPSALPSIQPIKVNVNNIENSGDANTINIRGSEAQEVRVGNAKNLGNKGVFNIGLQNLIVVPNANQNYRNAVFLV